jgi:hypothetical protein
VVFDLPLIYNGNMKLKCMYVLGGGYLIVYLLSLIPTIGILFQFLRSYLGYPTAYLSEGLFDYQISFSKQSFPIKE